MNSGMQKETQLRSLCERLLQTTLSTLSRRPLPASGHQAVSDLYNAVDAYTEAVLHNQRADARVAIEKLAVEALRVVASYELPTSGNVGIDKVRVESLPYRQSVESGV